MLPQGSESSIGKNSGVCTEGTEGSALAVMFRVPSAGRVKTRLTPPLTKKEVFLLYTLFLEDLFTSLKGLEDIHIYGFYTQDGMISAIPDAVRDVATLLPQRGRGLGERILHTFSTLFSMGYSRVVTIGSDSPDVPLEHIQKAFSMLSTRDCVIGPAEDGGYYLIGLKYPWKGLFVDIPWSTSRVLETTLQRARYLSVDYTLIDGWYDVDDTTGLLRLTKRNRKSLLSSSFAGELLDVF